MVGVSEIATGYALSKITEKLELAFHRQVIERWTKHRANQFLEALNEELQREKRTGKRSDNIEVLLDALLDNEAMTEVLYDAYRRVCFSSSRAIGPRIIGIITAQIISEEIERDYYDESIFLAAEQFKDYEFEGLYEFYKDNQKKAKLAEKKEVFEQQYGGLKILWSNEGCNSSWRKTKVDLSPLDMGESLGSWALKLKTLGLLKEQMIESTWDYEGGREGGPDEAGTAREIKIWITLTRSCSQLVELIERALKKEQVM